MGETNGGGGNGGGGATTAGARAPFVDPSFYRQPYFPYAGLAAQLQDALGLAGRGAGGFTGMMSPFMENVRLSRPNLGGGLLGMTAYARGTPYAPGNLQPGGGPAGTPTIPGGYAPGSPMGRPGAPVGPGMPGRGGAPIMPNPQNPGVSPFQRPGAPTGGARTQPAGLLGPNPLGALGARATGAGNGGINPGGMYTGGAAGGTPGAAAGGATLPYTPGQQFEPGNGNTSTASMLAYFNSLPENQRGNYINAIDQYSLGKGGANNLGAAFQQALRNQMGQANFDNWYATNVTNKQGSGVGREGLPPWLLSALGG